MKVKRSNCHGFAHLMVVVVVGVAAFGTYALVASHADTPTPSPAKLSCTIHVSPAAPKKGKAFTATFTIKNVGKRTSAKTSEVVYSLNGKTVHSKTNHTSALTPGESKKVVNTITLQKNAYYADTYASFEAKNPPSNCIRSFSF